jgi:multidrug efflux pump subunit AcrA (membrane-fusion protein)
VLQFVDVDEGESITAGQRVARIVSLEEIEIPLRMPAGARPFISDGSSIQLRSTGSLDQQWEGRIARVAPEDDAETRTFVVYVELRQEPGPAAIAPGQFLEGSVRSNEAVMRTVIPRRALQGDRVLVIRDGRITAESVTVDFQVDGERPETGIPDQQWVAISPEIPTGTLVVIEAGRALPIGLEVRGDVVGESGPGTDQDAGELARTRGSAEASP